MIKLEAKFTIYGDSFDPDELSKLVNIQSTDFFLKGEPTKNPFFFRVDTSWQYSTGKIETFDFEYVGDIIFDKFYPLKDKIIKFMTNNNLGCKVYVIVEMYNDDTPSLFFNRRFIDFASYLKAEIDVDMYIYKDDNL